MVQFLSLFVVGIYETFFVGRIEILVFVVEQHLQRLLANIIVEHAEKHFVHLVCIVQHRKTYGQFSGKL